jgi:hypothetical protein
MKTIFIVLSLALSLNVFAIEKGIKIDVSLSPAGSFQITSSKVKGKIKSKNGLYTSERIYVTVSDMKTGIDLRDDHMQKRLITKNKASKKITVSKVKAKDGKGTAIIEIKGMKNLIRFKYTTSGKVFTAKFIVNLKKFKIKDLKYLGVGAKEMVKVTANIPIK